MENQLEHSILGITSFVITMMADFFMIMIMLNSASFFVILFWILITISIVMGVVDLTQKNRKKTLTKLALVLGLPLIIFIIFIHGLIAPLV